MKTYFLLDCKEKINTNGNTKRQKHRHRLHKSHKKRRHGKKNTKQLPLSKGFQLQGEDHSAAYGWNMDSQVPRGVSRLVIDNFFTIHCSFPLE